MNEGRTVQKKKRNHQCRRREGNFAKEKKKSERTKKEKRQTGKRRTGGASEGPRVKGPCKRANALFKGGGKGPDKEGSDRARAENCGGKNQIRARTRKLKNNVN